MEFLIEHYESIVGLIAIIVSLITLGRKRATQLVLKYLDNAKEDFLRNIDKYAPSYAKYIYAKLPKTAKLFLSIKRIEKLIIKFSKEINALDK